MRLDARIRRYIECAIFTGVLMTSRWLFPVENDIYLSVPLALTFQLWIARRPISQMWVRDAEAFRLGWADLAIGVAFLALSIWVVARIVERDHPPILLVAVPSFVGVFIAAFVVRRQHAFDFWRGFPAFGIALTIGIGFMAAFAVHRGGSVGFSLHRLPDLLTDFWLMFGGMFVVEEVIFRGLLDCHLFQATDGRVAGWVSAAFVSVLWGFWHLPFEYFSTMRGFAGTLKSHLMVEIPLGVALSFCVRRSRTLLLPVVAHAAIDAYRNTILR